MLAKDNRLRRESDIKRLFAKGRRARGALVGLRFIKNDLKGTRFAVVVGTKVSKKAVERNRLRRQVREIIRDHDKNIVGGFDAAIVVHTAALGKSYADLKRDVVEMLKKTPLFT